jgi:hypothetical protein
MLLAIDIGPKRLDQLAKHDNAIRKLCIACMLILPAAIYSATTEMASAERENDRYFLICITTMGVAIRHTLLSFGQFTITKGDSYTVSLAVVLPVQVGF